MASVNPHTRELVFKLVFYGPGLGGKTTTLQYIHSATKPEHRGKMVSLATPTDRTLYFDFLPIRVPRVRGMAVRLQLFTVPGQVYYAATRKLVLSGADGIVFVADSQNARIEVNQESLDDLHSNLAEHNRSLDEIPYTFHWNKRDLTDLLSIEELDRRFNPHGVPSLGTVATTGDGVFDGLERITRLVLKAYEKDPKVRIDASSEGRPEGNAPEPGLVEEGVARAIRQMEHGHPVTESPTKISQLIPEQAPIGRRQEAEVIAPSRPDPSGSSRPAATESKAPARSSGGGSPPNPSSPPQSERTSSPERPSAPARASSPARAPTPERQLQERAAPAPAPAAPAAPEGAPSGSAGFSLSELWPESERDRVRQAEAMLGARDAVNAILACDVLITRVFASAAGLVGTLDAPRDPALVSLLLGLDGGRYMMFRSMVRAARHRESVTMRDAYECFAFSIEARRARDLLRR